MVDHPSPCPSSEELAAFLDGTLDAGRRSAVLAHLADCDECSEIVAGAAAVAAAARREPVSAVPPAADRVFADVVPIERGRARPARRLPLWIGVAATVLLVPGIALLLPSHRGDGGFPPAREVATALRATGDPAAFPEHFWGGDGDAHSFGATALSPSKTAFRAGVLLTDLQLAVAAGDRAAAGEVIARLSPLLAGDAESDTVAEVLAAIARGDAESAAGETAELAHAVELRLPAQPAAFGRWTESGRLAARTRRGAYFTRPEVREFPRELDAPPAPIARELKRIAETLRRGVSTEADWATLEHAFEQLQLLD